MTKYLVLVKCPESETYHPYDNQLVDKDTALALTAYLNELMNKGGHKLAAMNNGGYHYIATEIEFDELIG